MHLRGVTATMTMLLWAAAWQEDPGSTVAQRLDALLVLDQELVATLPPLSREERGSRIGAVFAREFSSELDRSRIAHHDNEDLSDLLRAASIRSFYSNDPATLDPMRAIVAELERRGALRHHDAMSLYLALLRFRRFDEAATLADANALQTPALKVARRTGRSADGRRVWAAASEDTLEERRLSPGPEVRLVMIAQPHCGFSKRAMATISANPRATAAFAKHALVLVPQSADVDARAVYRWNAAHPALAMVFVDAETDWPEITDWETPVFHVLQNGKTVQTVVGWPDDSRLETVLRLLDDAPAVATQSVGTASAKNARTSSSERVRENGGSESRNTRP